MSVYDVGLWCFRSVPLQPDNPATRLKCASRIVRAQRLRTRVPWSLLLDRQGTGANAALCNRASSLREPAKGRMNTGIARNGPKRRETARRPRFSFASRRSPVRARHAPSKKALLDGHFSGRHGRPARDGSTGSERARAGSRDPARRARGAPWQGIAVSPGQRAQQRRCDALHRRAPRGRAPERR